jgi:hypothetical protein
LLISNGRFDEAEFVSLQQTDHFHAIRRALFKAKQWLDMSGLAL